MLSPFNRSGKAPYLIGLTEMSSGALNNISTLSPRFIGSLNDHGKLSPRCIGSLNDNSKLSPRYHENFDQVENFNNTSLMKPIPNVYSTDVNIKPNLNGVIPILNLSNLLQKEQNPGFTAALALEYRGRSRNGTPDGSPNTTRRNPIDKYQINSIDNSQINSIDNSRSESRDNSRSKSRDNSRNKSRSKSRENSRSKSRSKSRSDSKDNSTCFLGSTVNIAKKISETSNFTEKNRGLSPTGFSSADEANSSRSLSPSGFSPANESNPDNDSRNSRSKSPLCGPSRSLSPNGFSSANESNSEKIISSDNVSGKPGGKSPRNNSRRISSNRYQLLEFIQNASGVNFIGNKNIIIKEEVVREQQPGTLIKYVNYSKIIRRKILDVVKVKMLLVLYIIIMIVVVELYNLNTNIVYKNNLLEGNEVKQIYDLICEQKTSLKTQKSKFRIPKEREEPL